MNRLVSGSLPLRSTATRAVPRLRDRSPRSLHCISLAPARLDRYPRGFTGHVAHPGRSIREQAARASSTRSVAAALWPRARVAQRRGYSTTSTWIGSKMIDHVSAAIGIAMRWLRSAERISGAGDKSLFPRLRRSAYRHHRNRAAERLVIAGSVCAIIDLSTNRRRSLLTY